MSFYWLTDELDAQCPTVDIDRVIGDPLIPCTIDPDDHPRRGRPRVNDLYVILPSPKVADFMISWSNDHIISDRVTEVLESSGVSGLELKPVVVTKVKGRNTDLSKLPKLWEIRVTGWGGFAPEESGIKLTEVCPGCDYTHYTSYLHPDKLVDTSQWDGSDFFMVWPLPRHLFVTDRVRQIVKDHRFSGMRFVPIGKMKDPNFRFGLSPGRLSLYMDPERAAKLGGVLGIA